MEAQEELKQSTIMMIKGKRTKRQRAPPVISPHLALTLSGSAAAPSTSSAENGGVSASATSSSSSDNNNNNNHAISASSTAEEEEDMANCLILLAQGRHVHDDHRDQNQDHDHHGPRTRHAGISNDVVYQCKTCDRCFPSFQALGGHRASHKKPKTSSNSTEEKNIKAASFDERLFSNTSTALSLQISPSRGILGINGNSSTGNNNVKASTNKVHECSICGAEFTSGQALGGHMRRHRTTTTSFMNPTTTTTTTTLSASTSSPARSQESKKDGSRNVLELDLNLPAPDVDERGTKFPFATTGAGGKEQVIVFSASPLVDCHY